MFKVIKTAEQIAAEQEAQAHENCKAEAKRRLEDTDWSQIADVAATLNNKADFDTYRAAVRALYFSPVAEPVWPERPEGEWA
jgi:hypothetical protein